MCAVACESDTCNNNSRLDNFLTPAVCCGLQLLARAVVGLAEVGPDQAGVGPGGCVLRELAEELNAALYE